MKYVIIYILLVAAWAPGLRAELVEDIYTAAYDKQHMKGDYAGAVDEYRQLLRLPPEKIDNIRVELIFRIGECQWYLGHQKEAVSTWRSITASPELKPSQKSLIQRCVALLAETAAAAALKTDN